MHRHGSLSLPQASGLRLGRRGSDEIDNGIPGQRALASLRGPRWRDPTRFVLSCRRVELGPWAPRSPSSLSSPASPSRAQVELHVPAGLTKLRAVEGAEVVLPAWYTLQGEVSSTKPKPWEVPTVIWFLLEGKNMNMSQVREIASARG